MTNKEKYRLLCEAEGAAVPLFQQYWWMENVCHGKRWDVLLEERDGRVAGALPYLEGRKLGMRYVLQPQLTQYTGPWLAPWLDFDGRRSVTESLVGQLDKMRLTLYCQCCAPSVTDWLPYYWHGYSQTTRYTYRFPSIADPDALLAATSRSRRRYLAPVERATAGIDRQLDPGLFAAMHADYWKRHGDGDWLPASFIARVCRTAVERGQGLLWGLMDKQGQPVCAVMVVYDAHSAYLLLSAIGPTAPRDSMTYLIWHLIRHLAPLTEAFDFEGSMDKGVEYHNRAYGTVQTPYFCIKKSRPRLLCHLLKL